MSVVADVVIVDGQASPVTHTFKPIKTGELTQWREMISGLALIGQGNLSLFTKLDQRTGLNRVRVVLELPALETITDANSGGYTAMPKVGYSHKASCEFILPSRGTAAQRKDLRVLLSNALLNATILDTVDNLNLPY